MAITFKGKVYRTLEEQVYDNQQTSNDAKDTAVVATQAVSAITGAVNELQTQMEVVNKAVLETLPLLEEEFAPLKATTIYEPVKSASGVIVSSATWDGAINDSTGVFDCYCTIPVSYTSGAGFGGEINIAQALFGGPMPIKLPEAVGTARAKEIFYQIHGIQATYVNGFSLSDSPLLTNANNFYVVYNTNPETTYSFNICIHVHGRVMA